MFRCTYESFHRSSQVHNCLNATSPQCSCCVCCWHSKALQNSQFQSLPKIYGHFMPRKILQSVGIAPKHWASNLSTSAYLFYKNALNWLDLAGRGSLTRTCDLGQESLLRKNGIMNQFQKQICNQHSKCTFGIKEQNTVCYT